MVTLDFSSTSNSPFRSDIHLRFGFRVWELGTTYICLAIDLRCKKYSLFCKAMFVSNHFAISSGFWFAAFPEFEVTGMIRRMIGDVFFDRGMFRLRCSRCPKDWVVGK